MANAVRIIGHDDDRSSNEHLQAQVDTLGNLMVREGVRPGLPKTYEDTSFVTGESPATHDFFVDAGRYAQDGFIVCDGAGNIQVDITRDGVTYSDKWTMKSGEIVDLERLDIKKIRVTWVSDSAYRILLV